VKAIPATDPKILPSRASSVFIDYADGQLRADPLVATRGTKTLGKNWARRKKTPLKLNLVLSPFSSESTHKRNELQIREVEQRASDKTYRRSGWRRILDGAG